MKFYNPYQFDNMQWKNIQFSTDDIIELHDAGIEKYGGLYGIRDKSLLKSATIAPYQEVFGQPLYPTPFDKAAKYLLDFSRYQIFLDGNKRTGMSSALAYLRLEDIRLVMQSQELYQFAMDISIGKISNCEDIAEI